MKMDSSKGDLLQCPIVTPWQPWITRQPHRPQPIRLEPGSGSGHNCYERRIPRPVVCPKIPSMENQIDYPKIGNLEGQNVTKMAKCFADTFVKHCPPSWKVNDPITQVVFNNSQHMISHVRLSPRATTEIPIDNVTGEKVKGRIFILSTNARSLKI